MREYEKGNSMEELRKRIDDTDREIIRALAKRLTLSMTIGEWKREHGYPVYDRQREEYVLENLKKRFASELSELCVSRHIPEDFFGDGSEVLIKNTEFMEVLLSYPERLYEIIFQTSREIQELLIQESDRGGER